MPHSEKSLANICPPARLHGRAVLIVLTSIAVITLSALVASARWWWFGELAASFAWHVGWFSLAAAGVLLAARAHRWALLAGALGCVNVFPEASLWLSDVRAQRADASLSVVSANLLQTNRHAGDVAEALTGTGADVIAVLELSLSMRGELERRLSEWPHRAYSPRDGWDGATWGLGVFSKRPIEELNLVQVHGCYARAIEVRVGCGSEHVRLRVVHIPRPGEAWRVRARNEALIHLTRVFDWDERSVLLGDLNTTSSSPAFGLLLDATGLHDSRKGFGRLPTWRWRGLGVPFSIAIDHALVGDRLEVLERSTFDLPFSDHDGVRVRLAPRGDRADR